MSLFGFFSVTKPTHITYKKAKTLEEAVEYSKKQLGISRFDVPDLELANQINYTLVKAYNKTGGKIHVPKNVEYKPIQTPDGHNPIAQMHVKGAGRIVTDSSLQINKSYIDNIDISIEKKINHFKNNEQIIKNKEGKECINLICEYKYSDTLNRYYRLYRKGNLPPKAKLDFDSILIKARDEEDLLLSKKDTLTKLINTRLGIDLNRLSESKFKYLARQALLALKNKNITVGSRKNFMQTQGAVGVDGIILHEQGHLEHAYSAGPQYASSILKPFNPKTESADLITAYEISKHSAQSKGEAIADMYAGYLSNDIYSENLTNFYQKYKGPKTS